MRNEHFLWAGLVFAGIAAGMALPKLRMAVRRIGAMTYTSGAAEKAGRPAADPARGYPA